MLFVSKILHSVTMLIDSEKKMLFSESVVKEMYYLTPSVEQEAEMHFVLRK